MDDLIEWLIYILFWPYLWWHRHNQDSPLGTSREEDETEAFWLKFAIGGAVVVGAAFALWYFLHRGAIIPPA